MTSEARSPWDVWRASSSGVGIAAPLRSDGSRHLNRRSRVTHRQNSTGSNQSVATGLQPTANGGRRLGAPPEMPSATGSFPSSSRRAALERRRSLAPSMVRCYAPPSGRFMQARDRTRLARTWRLEYRVGLLSLLGLPPPPRNSTAASWMRNAVRQCFAVGRLWRSSSGR